MLSVCLTGGPCGGKSSGIDTIIEGLESRGYKCITINEAPTMLINGGIRPGKDISMEDFQRFVLDEQLANEKVFRHVLNYYDPSKVVIIHDRGVCDQLAYVSREDFISLLKDHEMTLEEAYNRYDLVLHLVTAADGAEEHYCWNNPDGDVGNNAARSESPEEARRQDKKTLEAWKEHSNLVVVDNSTDFKGKMSKVLKEVLKALDEMK